MKTIQQKAVCWHPRPRPFSDLQNPQGGCLAWDRRYLKFCIWFHCFWILLTWPVSPIWDNFDKRIGLNKKKTTLITRVICKLPSPSIVWSQIWSSFAKKRRTFGGENLAGNFFQKVCGSGRAVEHQSVDSENRSKKTLWNASQLVIGKSRCSIWRSKGCTASDSTPPSLACAVLYPGDWL